MDYDADLSRPAESLVPDASNAAEESLGPSPSFGIASEEETVQDAPTALLDDRTDTSDSSLIEEVWFSSDRDCDHDLEYRLMAQEYEGLRMGRELHDSTAQLLLSLRLSIAHLKRAHELGESDQILEEISETARQIDQEIRAFSYLHYPAELGKGGIVEALKTLTRGFADRTGLKVVFKSMCDRAIANGATSVALLRVSQEALMNVHRHAHAGLVRMSLVERKGTIELSIQDDGQGLPPLASKSIAKGVGLQGMRHRVERLGGHFSIKRLKHGTKLVARLATGRGQPKTLVKPDGGKPDHPYHAQ